MEISGEEQSCLRPTATTQAFRRIWRADRILRPPQSRRNNTRRGDEEQTLPPRRAGHGTPKVRTELFLAIKSARHNLVIIPAELNGVR